MTAAHTVDLSATDLATVLAPLGQVREAVTLTGGMFAAATLATLADDTKVVVKVSGTDVARLCSYERGIARTEARTYRELATRGLPVPEVLLTDFTHSVVPGDVVVTRHLSGTPWNEADLDEPASSRVKHSLGALMARLHRVPAPAFGYPATESGMQAPDWRTAFGAMVEGILADAARTGTVVPADRIRAALDAHGPALDGVADAVFVHNDLWPANVFLDDGRAIIGIIDTERTVWGDPLLDLVGADQMGLWDIDASLIEGNTSAGGVLAAELASASGPTRFALYRLYDSLILVAEIRIRGYDGAWVDDHLRTAQSLVNAALAWLEAEGTTLSA
ncbi:phosphotransferase family protein [Demequina aestuarii]|uniref:phosphotransferase family protein n=1 Tax=Demequina aestuarii TaxID=327095 RepID=UPI0007807285|nr:aminoglycoside phosphotransferase family protein [Demequina aestuarii]